MRNVQKSITNGNMKPLGIGHSKHISYVVYFSQQLQQHLQRSLLEYICLFVIYLSYNVNEQSIYFF